jgi:hypothetical protein
MVKCVGPFHVFPGILGGVETEGWMLATADARSRDVEGLPFLGWSHGEYFLAVRIIIVASGSNGSCSSRTSCRCEVERSGG